MNFLIGLLICTVPFGAFFFRRIDLWHGQGIYFQTGLLILFCASFIFKPNKVKVKNIPLSLFVLWIGLWTIYISYRTMQIEKYFFGPLLIFLNILCMVVFYKQCVQYLKKKSIVLILKSLSFVFLALIVYGVLQSYGIDPFQKMENGFKADFATGLIGNPVHFSAYLACLSPLIMFWDYRLRILGYGLVLYLLFIGCAREIVPSTTGIITFAAITAYLLLRNNKYLSFLAILFVLVAVCIYGKPFFNDNSRILTIKNNLNYFKDNFILGSGLGSVNAVARNLTTVIKPFHQLHNEYIQTLIEIGVVGLGIVLFGIVNFFRIKVKEDKTIFILKAMFIGFLIQSLTLFPAHLWICSSLMMFVYSAIYAIKNDELTKEKA